jgi:hypothetical protein
MMYGYASTKLRTIRWPLLVGFVFFTGGVIGYATIEPGDSANALAFNALAGLGFGAPLVLVVAGVQLSTPHPLIATATAVTTSARAVAATIFTAVYSAAVTDRLDRFIPEYVGKAATGAGLPASSVPSFIAALSQENATALTVVPGISSTIIAAGSDGLKHAYADGLRAVYMIAAPFGALACIACFFLGDRLHWNYHVDAPVEDLHYRHRGAGEPS